MLPLIVEAFAHNKKIWPDIDTIYETNKSRYYFFATKSEYYNNIIIHEGDILREEYSIKMLGILSYLLETRDKNLEKQISEIIKKGWPRAFAYITKCMQENKEICMLSYIKEIFTSNPKITDDDINTELAILYSLAHSANCKIIDAEVFEHIANGRLLHGNPDSDIRFSCKIFNTELQKNISLLKQILFKHYDIIKHPNNILNSKNHVILKITEMAGLIADTEKLSLHTLFNDIKFTNADIDEIVGAYIVLYHNKNHEEAIKYFSWGTLLKGLLKAYNLAKETYFKSDRIINRVEQKLIKENEELKKQISILQQQLKLQTENIRNEYEKRYNEVITNLEKRIRELEKEIKNEQLKNNELFALREFLFKLNNETSEHDIDKEDATDKLNTKGIGIIIIGGHNNWQIKIRELLPEAIFIDTEKFDTKLFDNAKLILFCPWGMGHKLYYKAINEARKRNLKIGYVNNQNKNMLLDIIKKYKINTNKKRP